MIAVVGIAILAGIVFIAGWVVICERLERPRTSRHDEFANPADRTDPDGTDWIAEMNDRLHCLPGCDRLDGHDGRDTGACMHGGRAMTAPLASGTGFLEALPDDPAADITGVQPHDVKYLGKTSTEYVTEVFEKHAPPEMIA